MIKNKLKFRLGKAIFSLFFMIIGVFGLFSGTVLLQNTVYADPVEETTSESTETTTETTETTAETTETTRTTETASTTSESPRGSTEASCKNSLGAIGWLVCPTTGKIAEAVDWLYDKIEDILIINPVEAKDGSPIYEIWKYARGITNIVFIIFLLVVIYSQIIGIGISNYGIKKALPKLIVAAILVNLSFLICSLAVDVSNIVGHGLRGVFTSVEESVVVNMAKEGGMDDTSMKVSMAEMFSSLAGGTALTIGAAVVAFETGAIWMLIPVVLGAIIAVVSGLITIALRQAVVALLIMISPLAIIAYMLPNTDGLFKKWRKLLTQMLVFYPMFSLLFGASSLAGFAIIASAKDGFGLLLGVAIQIFPLFFSWSLMKMSGTVLGEINSRLNGLAAAPLANSRTWANSLRQSSKLKHLADKRGAYTPSMKLMQFMSKRSIARDIEMGENAELIKSRGSAYHAGLHYRKDGSVSRRGEEAYAQQAEKTKNAHVVSRDKNNYNEGLENMARNAKQRARLRQLDLQNMNASDMLNAEQSRSERIEQRNAKGFSERMEGAINAHMDLENGFEIGEDGRRRPKSDYEFHFDPNNLEKTAEMARYNAISQIMNGDVADVQYAAASAAHTFNTHTRVVTGKFQNYFDFTVPSKDLEYRVNELTKTKNPAENIDEIIAGLQIISNRGDTNVVLRQLRNVLNSEEGIELGSHASQALGNFLMFGVKDADPLLRRFGSYLNIETAKVFDENERQQKRLSLDEYVRGYYTEPNGTIKASKKPITALLEGTSFDGVERMAYDNINDTLMSAYGYDENDPGKEWDVDGYLKRLKEVQKAVGSQVASASLKYLSGSEQLGAAVKFLTGYQTKTLRDEKGNIVDYDLKPVWEGDEFAGHEDEVKEFYQGITEDYLGGQTPSQILALRSDYKGALAEHLMDAFISRDEDELSEDERAKKAEYVRRLSEIQSRYGDLPRDEAEIKRKLDIKKLRKEMTEDMAGREMRRLLDSKGTLEQIYDTRRSGAANNAKDWLRSWLNLNNKREIYKYLAKKDKEKNKEEKKAEVVVDDDSDRVTSSVYDAAFKLKLMERIGLLDNKTTELDDDAFYQEMLKFLVEELSEDNIVVVKYKQFKERDYPRATRQDLLKKLEELVDEL